MISGRFSQAANIKGVCPWARSRALTSASWSSSTCTASTRPVIAALISAGFYYYGMDLVAYGVLGGAALLIGPPLTTEGYSLIGGNLSQSQRDFRIYNNFTDADFSYKNKKYSFNSIRNR